MLKQICVIAALLGSSASQASCSQESSFQKVEVKPLPYPLDGLEPVISSEIMNLHYNKHHKGYANKFNGLIDRINEALCSGNQVDIVELTRDINFNGGGHYNHEFFWESLTPIA